MASGWAFHARPVGVGAIAFGDHLPNPIPDSAIAYKARVSSLDAARKQTTRLLTRPSVRFLPKPLREVLSYKGLLRVYRLPRPEQGSAWFATAS
jgi:hypothetical protein